MSRCVGLIAGLTVAAILLIALAARAYAGCQVTCQTNPYTGQTVCNQWCWGSDR